MGLLTRSGERAEAVYARVLDGETLWLAVHTSADALTLRLADASVDLPVETGADADGQLLVTRARLADLLPHADGLVGEVLAGRGRKAAPVTPRPGATGAGGATSAIPTRPGSPRRFVTEADGGLRLVQEPPVSAASVLGITSVPDGVLLVLAGASGSTVQLRVDGRPSGALPLVADREVTLPDDLDLPTGEPVTLWVDEAPLVRHANLLTRPNQAVALPGLGRDVEMRWQPDGRLALRRSDDSATRQEADQ